MGLSGDVTFNVPDTNNFQETAELSSNVLAEGQATSANCSTGVATSGLVLLGKGGIPPAPNLPLSADILIKNDKPIKPNFSQLHNQQQTNQNNMIRVQPIKTSVGNIYLARGIVKTEDGEVLLTAYPTSNSDPRTPTDSGNCHQVK